MQARPYQRQAIDRVKTAITQRPLLVAPVGSGKTAMAAMLVSEVGLPTLWLAHRKELIEQAAEALARFAPVGIIKAGVRPTPGAPIQVASRDTLVRREKPAAGLVVLDEAHSAPNASNQAIIAAYPDAYLLGLTATPFRLDGKGLGSTFGTIIVAATTRELVDAGYLHAPRVYCSRVPDLRGVKIVAGDFQLSALSEKTNTGEANADIVQTWLAKAAGKRTVCFAVDVRHSMDIVAAFREAGVAAEHLDGKTDKDTREAVLRRLASGATAIVSNVGILTEGYDLPSLECAIIARPTASLCLHIQCIGRVMRASPDKQSCTVLDHAGNHHAHGLVTRHLEYSLDKQVVGQSEPLGLRLCPVCFLMVESTEAACECGHVFTSEPRETIPVHGIGELTEFKDDFAYRREFWELLESQRLAMGFAEGWSRIRYKERFNEWPVTAEMSGRIELIDVKHPTMEQKRAVYTAYLKLAIANGYKTSWAAVNFRRLFGSWPSGFVAEVKRELGIVEVPWFARKGEAAALSK